MQEVQVETNQVSTLHPSQETIWECILQYRFGTLGPLLGKTLRAAEIELDQNGIELDSIYYSFSSKYPKGIVSWQSPTENDSIRKGFGVRIEVSNGLAPNDLVDVPDFQGIFLSEALKIIEERGFFEGKIQYVENKKFLPNTVLNQSPKEGTKVSQGSKINLVIAK